MNMYEGLCHFISATNIGDVEPFKSSNGWKCADYSPTTLPCNSSGSNWFGIKGCSDDGSPTFISLVNANIIGSLPHEIRLLKNLTKLELSYNSLYGTLSPDLGQLKLLNFLDVGYNEFSGSLPSSFGNLLKLKDLLVDGNLKLNGRVPASLCNVTRLRTLFLVESSNNVSGFECVPSCLYDVGNTQFGNLSTCTAIADPVAEGKHSASFTDFEITLIVFAVLLGIFLMAAAVYGSRKFALVNPEEGVAVEGDLDSKNELKLDSAAGRPLNQCDFEAKVDYLQWHREAMAATEDAHGPGSKRKCIELSDFEPDSNTYSRYTPSVTFANDSTPGSAPSASAIGSGSGNGSALGSVSGSGSGSSCKRFSADGTISDPMRPVPMLGFLGGDIDYHSPVASTTKPAVTPAAHRQRVVVHPCDSSDDEDEADDNCFEVDKEFYQRDQDHVSAVDDIPVSGHSSDSSGEYVDVLMAKLEHKRRAKVVANVVTRRLDYLAVDGSKVTSNHCRAHAETGSSRLSVASEANTPLPLYQSDIGGVVASPEEKVLKQVEELRERIANRSTLIRGRLSDIDDVDKYLGQLPKTSTTQTGSTLGKSKAGSKSGVLCGDDDGDECALGDTDTASTGNMAVANTPAQDLSTDTATKG